MSGMNNIEEYIESKVGSLNSIGGKKIEWFTGEKLEYELHRWMPSKPTLGLGFKIRNPVFFIPFFHWKDGKYWVEEAEDFGEEDTIFYFEVTSDLNVQLNYFHDDMDLGDDPGPIPVFELRLEHISEIFELVEYIFNTSSLKSPRTKFKDVNLSKIMTNVKLLIGDGYTSSGFIFDFNKLPSGVKEIVDLIIERNELSQNDLQFEEWIEKNNSLSSKIEKLFEDLKIISQIVEFPRCETDSFYFDAIKQKFVEKVRPFTLAIKFDLSNDISSVYFRDLLNSGNRKVLSEHLTLSSNLNNFVKSLYENDLTIMSSKHLQQHDSISRRCQLHILGKKITEFRDKVTQFPLENVAQSAAQAVHVLENANVDFLDKTYSLSKPLPSILERPFQTFKKSGSVEETCRNGEILLNLSLKAALYLFINSAATSPNYTELDWLTKLLPEKQKATANGEKLKDLGALEELTSQHYEVVSTENCSDGKLLRMVIDRAILEKRLKGPFQVYAEVFLDLEAKFKELVEARNRRHHAPFDSEGLAEICNKNLPEIFAACREALNDFEFVYVSGLKNVRGKKQVIGTDLKVFDGIPEPRVWDIRRSLDDFPTDVISVFNDRIHPVVLETLFSTKISERKFLQIGVLDRFKNGTPVFDFF